MTEEEQAILDGYKKDAERYRWLRERSAFLSSPGGYVTWGRYEKGVYQGDYHASREVLDRLIDEMLEYQAGCRAEIERLKSLG